VPQEYLGLFDKPASRRHVALALALVGFLFAAFLVVLPFSKVPTVEIVAFVPVIDSVMFAGELIIAALLYGQAGVFRSRALTLLASSFVFMALLLVPHALSLPGAFAPEGLFRSGTNSTAWVMIVRRLAFPLSVILYVVLKTTDEAARRRASQRPLRGSLWISSAIALAGVVTVFVIGEGDLLPPIFSNRSDAHRLNLMIANISNIAAVLVAMAVLFRRGRSVLDIWLQVALAGWLIQSVLNMFIDARFTVGFYSLYFIMFCSHLFVLLALMAESNRLYARLAVSKAAFDRDRDRQMMSMEAVAATISHEVGQPLAAVALSAAASLKALTHAPPNQEKAIQSLRHTIDAAQRAFDVIKSVRTSLNSGSGSVSEFSLNDLVRQTAALLDRELAARKILIQLVLEEDQLLVLANRVQLQRVLINLLTNAMESMGAPESQARGITIRSTLEDENVLIEVSDTGSGIDPDEMPHIFDPFVTTNATGTGLGLSLSRTILEAHRGRLWASHGAQGGATFHLVLPQRGPAAQY
jgi:signal transduction histidine kinase